MNNTIQEILNAFEVIKESGIILHPIDTVWKLGMMPLIHKQLQNIHFREMD